MLEQATVRRIRALVQQIEPAAVTYRRDFHRYPEAGWTEFRTASLVARRLTELGYRVDVGQTVIRDTERMGLPSSEALEAHWQRARAQGADTEFLPALAGGFTGVVGTLAAGAGPTVALRFDLDALEIAEASDRDHRPAREGFTSVNEGVMHACGHDAHAAIGLGIAEVLGWLRDEVRGTVRLIFQPAEEGVRGARSMVAAGVCDDVDFLLGLHVMSGWRLGEVSCGMGGYAATRKFDATFKGVPSHAGANPQCGHNALIAAATAVLNLYAIARHGDGATRINVGKLDAGASRNVIPAEARLAAEVRGASSELCEYMYAEACRILEAAAAMQGCELATVDMGAAQSAISDEALARRVERVATELGDIACCLATQAGGSEDVTYMMQRVQQHGGLAAVVGIGADFFNIGCRDSVDREKVLRAHTERFDLDERALGTAIALLSAAALDLMTDGADASDRA
ncbi:MAG: M20 family metallo-hydrolase [Chloroflexi bacterium]|nr:M20 family metallo-hydrolase [Chloroflexota bacterium]